MVICTCGRCTSIWKGKTPDSLHVLTTPGNTDENTTGQSKVQKGSKYWDGKEMGFIFSHISNTIRSQ